MLLPSLVVLVLVGRLLGPLVLELVLALLLLELELLVALVPALRLLVADDVRLLVPPFSAFLALLELFSPRPFFVAFARLPPFVGVVELLLLVKLAAETPPARVPGRSDLRCLAAEPGTLCLECRPLRLRRQTWLRGTKTDARSTMLKSCGESLALACRCTTKSFI